LGCIETAPRRVGSVFVTASNTQKALTPAGSAHLTLQVSVSCKREAHTRSFKLNPLLSRSSHSKLQVGDACKREPALDASNGFNIRTGSPYSTFQVTVETERRRLLDSSSEPFVPVAGALGEKTYGRQGRASGVNGDKHSILRAGEDLAYGHNLSLSMPLEIS
jgi:hypothetical protein